MATSVRSSNTTRINLPNDSTTTDRSLEVVLALPVQLRADNGNAVEDVKQDKGKFNQKTVQPVNL